MHDQTTDVPYGYCHCGCGQRTKPATQSRKDKGHIKGRHMQYVVGHATRGKTVARARTPIGERVLRYIEVRDDGCWIWKADVTPGGYGRLTVGNTSTPAHRASYEAFIGPIPDGLQIDHLCRVTTCVNPNHLEPVTASENKRRAALLITHCPQGHPYDDANTYVAPRGDRHCRACQRIRASEKRAQTRRTT